MFTRAITQTPREMFLYLLFPNNARQAPKNINHKHPHVHVIFSVENIISIMSRVHTQETESGPRSPSRAQIDLAFTFVLAARADPDAHFPPRTAAAVLQSKCAVLERFCAVRCV